MDNTQAGLPLHYQALHTVAALIRQKSLSPVELTQAMLQRIEAVDVSLHAFATVTAELALMQAAHGCRLPRMRPTAPTLHTTRSALQITAAISAMC